MAELAFVLELPDPLLALIRTCEVHCVAGCCGTDAFDPDPEHMVPWFRENAGSAWQVFDQFADVAALAREQPGEIASPQDELSDGWTSAPECVEFFGGWRRVAVQAYERAVGRPFPAVEPDWRTSTVVALAAGIDADRAFDRLPVLADALEDAGCTHPDVLGHLRDPGPHARGCWVVDLILGKS